MVSKCPCNWSNFKTFLPLGLAASKLPAVWTRYSQPTFWQLDPRIIRRGTAKLFYRSVHRREPMGTRKTFTNILNSVCTLLACEFYNPIEEDFTPLTTTRSPPLEPRGYCKGSKANQDLQLDVALLLLVAKGPHNSSSFRAPKIWVRH